MKAVKQDELKYALLSFVLRTGEQSLWDPLFLKSLFWLIFGRQNLATFIVEIGKKISSLYGIE